MRRFVWIAVAALAGIVGGCADENALYTSPKYVPGYTPSGYIAHAYDRQYDRGRSSDWRER
jgi:hypothetical protein